MSLADYFYRWGALAAVTGHCPEESIMRNSQGGERVSQGIGPMVAGVLLLVAVDFEAGDQIMVYRDTAAGVLGWISCPVATRNAALGTATVNSSNAGDTSTVIWCVMRTR
jgi:hypothetical protein